jgi:hypothetical protein
MNSSSDFYISNNKRLTDVTETVSVLCGVGFGFSLQLAGKILLQLFCLHAFPF